MDKQEKAIIKKALKMDADELQQYLYMRRRGFIAENKKGKGSYKRHDKHKNKI